MHKSKTTGTVLNSSKSSEGKCTWMTGAVFTCCLTAVLVCIPATVTAMQVEPASGASTGDDFGSNQETTTDEDPVTFFRNMMDQIESNEKEINRLYTTMPIGFPTEQEKCLKQIDSLKKINTDLGLQIDGAALESFRAAPNQDPQATRIVLEIVSHKLDGQGTESHFDPQGALDIVNRVLQAGIAPESGKSPVEAAYLAFRANYATHNFERAGQMLDFIAQNEVELNASINKQLEDSQIKWQRELAIRQQEGSSDDLPRVKFETSEGEFVVELFENEAPQTVGNFVNLVEKQFYNDLVFHLVRPGQFAQTGCPQGDGKGDAGYKIPCETDLPQIRHHFAGTLSMAHSGKDTGGSQFFISHQPNRNYDGNYTAFGRVISGLDTVYKLKTANPAYQMPGSGEPSKIIRASVIRKRDHEYSPTRIAKQPNVIRGNGSELFQTIPATSSVPNVDPDGGKNQ